MNYLELLSGDAQTFTAEVWGRRPLIHQADPAQLQQIFGLNHADQLLTTSALRTPQVRLAKQGKVLDQSLYTRQASIAGQSMTGLLDPAKVLAQFDDGATIVFQGLQRYWEPLRQLVRGLEQQLGHPCQANAYLTPPGSQGFALHRDSHDVFTFQTYGSKEWEIHDAGAHQVVMLPGTSMYLPTGTPHMARTGQDTASLHVTLGINRVVWSDFLRDVVNRAISADPRQAEPLPAALFTEPDRLADALRSRLADLAARLQSVDALAEVDRLETSFSSGRQPVLAGALLDLLDTRRMDAGTPLRRRRGSQCTVRHRDGKLELLLGDRRLTMPLQVEDAVRVAIEADQFSPGELDQLNADSAVVLCRRLVREGLLEVVR